MIIHGITGIIRIIVSLRKVASSEEAVLLHDGLRLSKLLAGLRKQWMMSGLCV
jgi:hypothetical protein